MASSSSSSKSTCFFLVVLAISLACYQVQSAGLDLGGLIGGLVNSLQNVLGQVLSGQVLQNVLDLVNQIVSQISGGGQGFGILARLLGGCGGGQPCCGCCNRTSTGVNDVCVTIGLLDFLVGTAECPTGSIVACTGQACQVGDTCNALNLANLACLNVGKK